MESTERWTSRPRFISTDLSAAQGLVVEQEDKPWGPNQTVLWRPRGQGELLRVCACTCVCACAHRSTCVCMHVEQRKAGGERYRVTPLGHRGWWETGVSLRGSGFSRCQLEKSHECAKAGLSQGFRTQCWGVGRFTSKRLGACRKRRPPCWDIGRPGCWSGPRVVLGKSHVLFGALFPQSCLRCV